jgi:ClpP class serine protease
LASAADKLMLSQTASVGSVGVIAAHNDASKAMDEAGFKVTLIHAGAHKADGNPYEPLPDDVKATVQGELDDLRQLFAASVAAGRGMTTARVLETEARMYLGQAAVDIGLADKVMSFDAALAEFTQTLAKQGGFKQGLNMSKVTDTTATSAASADAGETVSMQTHLAALAAGNADALKAGASAERERIAAVLNAPNAKGREATAQVLALSTSMTAVEADAILATVAATAPNTAKDAAREAALAGMAQAPGAKLASADAGNLSEQEHQNSKSARLAAHLNSIKD